MGGSEPESEGRPVARPSLRNLFHLTIVAVIFSSACEALPSRHGGSFTATHHLVGSVRTPSTSLRPGMVFRRDGFALLVPPPGSAVWAARDGLEGERTMGVETLPDGTVRVQPGANLIIAAKSSGMGGAGGASSSATAIPACTDGAYVLNGTKWRRPVEWYFNSASTPSGISVTDAVRALRHAASNITRARNSCGLADRVSAQASYLGATARNAGVGSSNSCQASDGRNVVSFGNLAGGTVGYTCWWSSGETTVEADFKLNKHDYGWTVDVGSGCRNKFGIQDLATHEFGHVFGLGHVGEASHGNLTMSPVIRPCQNSETTLGLGDVRGLEALYLAARPTFV
jgi:hypothetical protein